MGIKDRFRKLATSVDDINDDRVRQRLVTLGLTPIGGVEARVALRIGGEIKRLRTVPRSGVPSLDVLITDGTGEIHAVFTGRRALGGIEPGRAVVIEGVARRERGELVILNPSYTLIAG